MYKKILVPLDGSKLAECVLPHVQAISAGCSVPEVVLLRVVQPFRTLMAGDGSLDGEVLVSPDIMAEIEEQSMKDATSYMEQVQGQVKFGRTVRTEIVRGSPADSIADYAEKNGVDLIVIATHGRSGMKRWVLGSVADRLVRASCVPVMMIRAPGCVAGI